MTIMHSKRKEKHAKKVLENGLCQIEVVLDAFENTDFSAEVPLEYSVPEVAPRLGRAVKRLRDFHNLITTG